MLTDSLKTLFIPHGQYWKILNFIPYGSVFENFEFTYDNLQKLDKSNVNDSKVYFLDSLGFHQSFQYIPKLELDYAGANFQYDIYEKQAQGFGVFLFSDTFGDHKLNFQTSLVIDLEKSDIVLEYMNLKKRINWGITFNNNVYPGPLYIDYINAVEFYTFIKKKNY